MIRVLIAEDEPPTLRRMVRLIEEADPAFSVAATAADGEEALEKMRAAPCDVVFSDIRMPVMDGLQLMDALRAEYPECQVVIISGHQDFAYVTHAVRASAVDYLLKPVSREDMAALAVRLKETHARREKERLTRRLSASLNRTVARPMQPSREAADASFSVCLFCAGPAPLGDAEGLLLDGADLEGAPLEAALGAALPGYTGFSWAFMGNTQAERILIFEGTEAAGRAAARVREALEAEVGAPVSCVCAGEAVTLAEVGKTIAGLRRILLASVRIGQGVFVEAAPGAWGADAPQRQNDHHTAKRLSSLLQDGGFSAAGAPFLELLQRMEAEGWTQERIHGLFVSAFAYLEAERGMTRELSQARALAAEVLSGALSFSDLAEGLSGLDSLFGAQVEDQDLGQTVAARVEQYLVEHYAEHINNQTLGTAFGYVPSYISLLFRRAYGVSPAEYLTRLRLLTAKRMMRERPDLLVRDVAERVGFKSPYHFSRIFKKHEGVWPTGYTAEGEVAE